MVEMMAKTGVELAPEMKKSIDGVDFSDEHYGLEILKREARGDRSVTPRWDRYVAQR